MSVEIPERVKQALVGRERPEDRAALEAELAAARARGFKIPAIDTAQMVITAEQARVAIKRAGLDESSLFGKIMVTYRGFPRGMVPSYMRSMKCWRAPTAASGMTSTRAFRSAFCS